MSEGGSFKIRFVQICLEFCHPQQSLKKQCSVIIFLIHYLLNETFMDVKKIPKFPGNKNDGQCMGHDENEWGKPREVKQNETVTAYDLKGNKNKNNNCITCEKNYEFIGSKFCSKNCYEKYFIPTFD